MERQSGGLPCVEDSVTASLDQEAPVDECESTHEEMRRTMVKPRTKSKRRGASAVEMAFIAPVFLTLVLGIIESSRLGMVSQLLTTAAREGCRVAVINGMTQTDVQNRINGVLNGSGISVGTVTPTCPSPYSWDSAAEWHSDHGEPERPLHPGELAADAVLPEDRHHLVSATMSCERP